MKKIVLSIGSVLAIIFLISMWWRYTYCREIYIFKNKEEKYEITSVYYINKNIDIAKIDTNAIDRLLCDAKGTRTYYCYYPYNAKEYPLDIDYRREFQDLISIHCGKEGIFFSFGTGSNKTYSVVNGKELAADLLKVVEEAN